MTSIELSVGDPPKRTRQVNEEVASRVAVRRALDEVLGSIGQLQQAAVLLETQVTRAPSGRDCLSYIRSLEQGVLDVSRRLDGVVTSLPEHQRTHSRVIDARRAVDGIRRRTQAADSTLQLATQAPREQARVASSREFGSGDQ